MATANDIAALTERLLDVLPQTQCTKCGYDGCRPYAQAIADGRAEINRCPPGGAVGIERLAAATGRPPIPLDPACGPEDPLRIAWIDPALCIGCTLCIQACPVDAIVGAARRMHVVIDAQCTGCDLCVVPCPMDCIHMRLPPVPRAWSVDDARAARRRHEARAARPPRDAAAQARRRLAKAELKLAEVETQSHPDTAELQRRRRLVQSAIDRARQLSAPPERAS